MKLFHQTYVKYGLIMCGALVICLFFMELTGNNTTFEKSPFAVLWTFILPAVVWFFGIKDRKQKLKNKLTFKQGLFEGFKISLVFAIVSPFIFMLYYVFVNPGVLDYVRNTYGLQGVSDTTVILADMAAQFVAAIVFGTIYGAVISFILKSR